MTDTLASLTKYHIPIRNLYYLLCYAWKRLPVVEELADVDALPHSDALNLLTHLLSIGINQLLAQGLDRGYTVHSEDTGRPRGKLNLAETISRGLLRTGRVNCEVTHLTHNILHNQILKTTISFLLRTQGINQQLHDKLIISQQRMKDVDCIFLSPHTFSTVRLNRNNRHYLFLLHICQLINEYLMPIEGEKGYKFQNFLRDERKMRLLFEEFVRNFYRQHAEEKWYVKRKVVRWATLPDEDTTLLPRMETDITLANDSSCIVFETKFTKAPLKYRFNTPKVKSEHLYQLLAYLKNLEAEAAPYNQAKGILLYAQVGEGVDLTVTICEHPLQVVTLNLAEPWESIHQQLLELLE